MKKIHECKFVDNGGAEIVRNNSEWVLILTREATEQDLEENHYLEMEGEVIEEITLPVNFCPYCGQKLTEGNQSKFPSYKYQNYSEW